MSNDSTAIGHRPAQAPPYGAAEAAVRPINSKSVDKTTPAEVNPRPVAKGVGSKPESTIQFDSEAMMKNLREAIERLNEQAEKNGRGLSFSVDEQLNRHIITVRNTSSGEVVRQIPTEVAIKVAHNLDDIKGLLLDETS